MFDQAGRTAREALAGLALEFVECQV